MKCIWCEKETTTDKTLENKKGDLKYANKEHIFPESIGGKKTLPVGLVCKDCNDQFGNTIDSDLKYSSRIFLELYQKSSIIKGSPIGKVKKGKDPEKIKARLRKEKEMWDIESKQPEISGIDRITRDISSSNTVTYESLNPVTENQYNFPMSKGIHKCAFNSLLHLKGYDYTLSNLRDLRDFILHGTEKDAEDWSYAICHSATGSFVSFEPFYIPLANAEDHQEVLGMLLVFPTAIFIVGLNPNIINAKSLRFLVDQLPALDHWKKDGFNYKLHYKKSFKLIEISKEVFSNPVNGLDFEICVMPKSFEAQDKETHSLVTECCFCKNTTPIGISIPKVLYEIPNIS